MTFRLLFIAAAMLLTLGTAHAQQAGDVFVFPNDGQDQDQQDLDTVQCQRWARENTGFDPSQRPTASSAPPPDESSSTGGGVARGAVLGAAAGAIIGGSSSDVGRGAAAGGLLGGARSNRRNRENDARQQQWEQQQMAEYNRNRSNWNRAFAACMEGRGYTVR